MAKDRVCVVHELLTSLQRGAATYNSDWKQVGSSIEGLIMVSVTAESGTATLDITVQTSPDESLAINHTTLSQITGTGTVKQSLTEMGKWIRVSAIVGGSATPKFTFSIHLAVKT